MIAIEQPPLGGKKGFVLGIASEHSIAYGCAKAFRPLGAELAMTHLNDKAKPFGEPLRETHMAILNVAASGRFLSDRTIADYVAEIWRAEPCPVS